MKPNFLFRKMLLIALLLGSTAVYAQNAPEQPKEAAKSESSVPEEQPSEMGGWRVTDFQPYVTSIRDLEKLNKEYSETMLKQAVDEYSTGLSILEDVENEIIKFKAKSAKQNNLNERWYWQEIDRANQEKRYISRIKWQAKLKATTHLIKAIDLSDSVQSLDVRKDAKFVNFQVRLFQVYVSTQYDIQNFKPCIPILERYVNINDKTKNDVWAYKYLASCYGFMEASLTKYKGASETVILDYKQKKNAALLTATELNYGVESPQYKQLKEIVEMDEKKSLNLNE